MVIRIKNLPLDENPAPSDSVAVDGSSTRKTTIEQLVAASGLGELAATAVQPGDLGTSAPLDVGTTAGTVAAGNDERIVGSVKKLTNFYTAADFDAEGDGIADDSDAFDDVAAETGFAFVAPGNYKITRDLAEALWFLYGASISGLPDLSAESTPDLTVNDLRRLRGRIIQFNKRGDGPALMIGDPNPWMEQYIRPAAISHAEFYVGSTDGLIAISGASKTSDNPGLPGFEMSCIGGNFYAINDKPVTDAETSAYGIYAEARRRLNGGAAVGMEIDIANQDPTVDLTPNSPLDFHAYTFGHIINSGAGLPNSELYPASVGLMFGNNGNSFRRGIVFNDFCIDGTTQEAIAMPIFYRTAYYSGGSLFAYSDNREVQQRVDTDTAGISPIFGGRRRRTAGAATENNDIIGQLTFQGFSTAASDYMAGNVRAMQRGNFASDNARTSLDIQARNASGALSEISLNGMGDATFGPVTDNTHSLGHASARWSLVYAATGTINTSDPSLKRFTCDHTGQDAADQEMKALAMAVKRIPVKTYQWLDAIAEKGDDARTHIGVSAQDVLDAFEAEGLDARRYALFCEDPVMEWVDFEEEEDVPDMEIVQEDGIEQVVEGDRVIQKQVARPVERQKFVDLPIYAEDGSPVMKTNSRVILGEDGKPAYEINPKTGAKSAKREVYQVPATYRKMLTKRELVKKRELRPALNEDGSAKIRMALRYDQLLLLKVAATSDGHLSPFKEAP